MKTKNVIMMAMFIIAVSVSVTAAQEKTNYIISGEVASFYPAAVNRQFIRNDKWLFELKETEAKYSCPLTEVQPFTLELRAPNTGTGIRPVIVND
jgi:hypothetical protein